MYKSLESIKINKAFEKISFNSSYICTVFGLLSNAISANLISMDLFVKTYTAYNKSLHDILTDVIDSKITIQDATKRAVYEENVSNIRRQIEKMGNALHIAKLVNIHKQIRQSLDRKQPEMIGIILSSLDESCKSGKIAMSQSVFHKIKPLYECLHTLTNLRKTSVAKRAKNLLSEWKKYETSKVNKRRISGKKRKSEGKIIAKQPPKKKQKMNKIRDCSDSESESESVSGSDDAPRPRRSLRKSKGKNDNVSNSKIMQSDLYGNESEDDSLSDDERNERLQLKEDRNFIKNKRKNKKRIESQQQKEKTKTVSTVSNVKKKVRDVKRKRGVEAAKTESPELSDSPSLSSLSDFEGMSMNNKAKVKKVESVNKATKQILDKFINAFENKGNIMIWLNSLKVMKAEQLSMIKDNGKFVDYLKKLRGNAKYNGICKDILNKVVSK